MADQPQKRDIFSDLKIAFPDLLSINIFVTFAVVIVVSMIFKVPVDGAAGQLLEVLKNIVLIMVGFYFGSSSGSKDANQAMKQMALSGTTNGKAATVAPWWSLLTDAEKAAITADAPNDPRVAAFITTASAGHATTDDLSYLVSKGLLTQGRATAIEAA